MKNSILNLLKNLLHPAGILGIIIALVIPFLVYLGPNQGHKDTIKQLDLDLPLPLFLVQLLAFIALVCFLNKDFRDWIRTILPAKKFSILMLAFTAAITIFAGTQIEARHRVQSDESVFMSVAQNMYFNHESGTCNQGIFKEGGLKCVAKSNSFKTKGLAFIYYLGMPLFGNDLHWIFNVELILLPLSLLLMFLAIVAWTRQPLLAFFATLLLGLQPTVLFQYRAMSVEPLYIFLSALTLLVFKWAYDRNTLKHWILLALVMAFFAQTRQETVFCFFAFILFALPKILDKKDFKAPAFFVVLSIFSVPVLLTISYFQGFGFQGGEFEAHGHFIEDLTKNWEVMTKPLNDRGELSNPFLTYFNYLFLIGLIYLLFRAVFDAVKGKDEKRFFYLKVLAFLALYHIQTYVILENVSGDFTIEINQRYSLVMLPSMAFLAALPLAHIISYFVEYSSDTKCKVSKTNPTALLLGALIVALAFTGWTFHYKECFNKNIMYNRNHLTIEEHEILAWLGEQPVKNRLFIYARPWHFVGYGISSIHYDKARRKTDIELKELIDEYEGEVYYIRGLDCWDSQTYHKKAVEHRIPTTCDVFEKEMDLEGVKNILVTNNYWVQIAKFHGKRGYNAQNILSVDNNSFILKSENADSTFQLQFKLMEKADVVNNWEITVTVNNRILQKTNYVFGEQKLNIEENKLQPGYNQFRFNIKDNNTDKTIADNSYFYFYDKNGVIPLSNINYTSHKQAWGTLQKNRSVEKNNLTIDGQIFENGMGTHANSETVYDLQGKYSTFRTSFGLDDESLCSEGVLVEIIGDGNILARSPLFKNGELQTLTARVEGVQQLIIKSKVKDTNIDCSHVDFVNSILVP